MNLRNSCRNDQQDFHCFFGLHETTISCGFEAEESNDSPKVWKEVKVDLRRILIMTKKLMTQQTHSP